MTNSQFDIPFMESSEQDCYGIIYSESTSEGDMVPCNDNHISIQNLSASFCPFSSNGNLLVVGDDRGGVLLQDVTQSGAKSIICGDSYAINDLNWVMYDGKEQVVIGGSSGIVSLWTVDTEAGSVLKSVELKHSTSNYKHSVTCITTSPHIPGLIITGTDTNNINVWNLRKNKVLPVEAIPFAHYTPGVHINYDSSTKDGAITSVFLKNKLSLFSAGKGNKLVHMWNINKRKKIQNPVKSFQVKARVTSITMSHKGCLVYVSCSDNSICCFNSKSEFKLSNPICRLMGHKMNSLYNKISLSPCGQYLCSGSSNKFVHIWSTNLSAVTLSETKRTSSPDIPTVLPIAKLLGHNAEVTTVQWAPAFQMQLMLVSLADDSSRRLWQVPVKDKKYKCVQSTSEMEKNSKWFKRGVVKIIDKKFEERLQNADAAQSTVVFNESEAFPAKVASPKYTLTREINRVTHCISQLKVRRQRD